MNAGFKLNSFSAPLLIIRLTKQASKRFARTSHTGINSVNWDIATDTLFSIGTRKHVHLFDIYLPRSFLYY